MAGAPTATRLHDPIDWDEHAHTPPRPFARLKDLLQPERRDIVIIVLFAVAVAILSLSTPIAVESLVNTVAFGVLIWPVLVIAGILVACLGLAAAIRALQVYVVECLQRRLFVRVVADYAHRFPRIELAAFDRRHGPDVANRFFDVLNLQKSLATLLLDGVALVVSSLVGMVVLAFYHPFLLGFDILLVLLIAFAVFVLGLGGVRSAIDESHAKYDVAAWLQELLREPRAFKFAGGSRLALAKAEHLTEHYVDARRQHFRVVWRQTTFALGLQVIAGTALLSLGGYLVIDRQLTLGQLVAAELIVTLVVASVAKIGKYSETFYDLLAGAEKLGIVTDLPLDRTGGAAPPDGPRGADLTGPGWHVAAGERVAVVGAPGSGITTFFETLCGLRESAGGIAFDGIDLRSLAPDLHRDRVALVEAPDLFAGSIEENLVVGRGQFTPADVRDALQTVGLLGVVHRLPRGPETLLTPNGRPLSRTQSLQLGIARALVGRPRLLIFDGTLDPLDLRECPDLLPRLFDRAAPWTLMIATNRSDLLALCDRTLEWPPAESAETKPS